jgi:hypothetical protein
MSESYDTSQAPKSRAIDFPAVLGLAGITLAYALLLLVIYALFGGDVARWVPPFLWGIPFYYFGKWDKNRTPRDMTWREYLKFPQLRLWKVLLILLTIFIIQYAFGYIAGIYLDDTQPDLIAESYIDAHFQLFSSMGSSIITFTGMFLSYFLGGVASWRLSPNKYQAPYKHTFVGACIYTLLSNVIIQYLSICECGPPTLAEIGGIALGIPMTISLSIFGTWVAVKTRSSGSKNLTGSLSRGPKHGADPEPFAAQLTPDQQTADSAKSNSKMFRASGQNRKQRKKQKRR